MSNSAIWAIDRRFFSAPVKMFKSDISFDFGISDKSVVGTLQANCGFPSPRQHVKILVLKLVTVCFLVNIWPSSLDACVKKERSLRANYDIWDREPTLSAPTSGGRCVTPFKHAVQD